jgi:hypothetical protein
MSAHIPVVRIITPEPNAAGITPAVLTRMTIDGQEWAIVSYELKSHVDGIQHLILEVLADVTVRHPEP